MNDWVGKFIDLEREISKEKGSFSLFALFLREDSIGNWDLVAAAPWIEADRNSALHYITQQISATLTPEEIVQIISRVVLINLNNPSLNEINKNILVEHGLIEVFNAVFFGLEIKRALIITSQKLNADVEALTI